MSSCILAALPLACGGVPEHVPPSGALTPAPPPALMASTASTAALPQSPPLPAPPPAPALAPRPAPACPEDMVFVDTVTCPRVELRCLDSEYNQANHITICHAFAPGQVCLTEPRRQRFCIDRYEYPNREGAHPPVMVDWYDAAGACASRGKRLCWESEWVAACEGPEKLPFPYGLERDPAQCNIDNPWRQPNLDKIYAQDPAIQGPQLLRLDQSVPSGAKKGCVSGFGVHDLTGNVDEWVNAESPRGKAKWAGLKGGAWGHVRNACRPMTTSHPPEFTYYFISFRCCADAAPEPGAAQDPRLWTPPPPPDHPDPSGHLSPGWTPQ
ncbi:formylglycine-generating enzyme family protein [Chondromyces apiculatus]|uniref:Sulfatase-modifying factor 2 (C-alpha-formyglycine-generating enzyme 2) n=1 Tax=Chondromyces apiculatus DSM 436 TaxID=1192034 RepID=A0A017TAT4_9BACT|nr:SUMF1/EgtB/PvdO family nonheme iron enzyme [Chondromyces apiculatus]EYF05935.1 Sulfatase-modifying factor 2 precursor (C-alpha-formyglycine-generating enzyme 2) [Chondromyces apiculatus DSM 436]